MGVILPTVGVGEEIDRAHGRAAGAGYGVHGHGSLDDTADGLVEVPGDTVAGGTTVNLQGRFQTTITLRRNADGSVSQHCESVVKDSRASE